MTTRMNIPEFVFNQKKVSLQNNVFGVTFDSMF